MDKHDAFKLIDRGDAEGLEAALQAGVEPGARDGQGFSLLYAAAAKGDSRMVKALLDTGAEINKTTDAGNSALMVASARGHLEVVEQLLAAGADRENKNRWGMDARDWAKWPANGGEIISMLKA